MSEDNSREVALWAIRSAGGNTTKWAVWAQKMAAWGLEPKKWPRPDAYPPHEVSGIGSERPCSARCNEGKTLNHMAGPDGPIEIILDCETCSGLGYLEDGE